MINNNTELNEKNIKEWLLLLDKECEEKTGIEDLVKTLTENEWLFHFEGYTVEEVIKEETSYLKDL